MYFYCFFSFEYFDPFDHYAACWVTLTVGLNNFKVFVQFILDMTQTVGGNLKVDTL